MAEWLTGTGHHCDKFLALTISSWYLSLEQHIIPHLQSDHNDGVFAKLLQWCCYCKVVTTMMWLQSCHNEVIAQFSPWWCSCKGAIIVLSQWWCYCRAVIMNYVIANLWQRWCDSDVLTMMIWLQSCRHDDVITKLSLWWCDGKVVKMVMIAKLSKWWCDSTFVTIMI